MATEMGTDGEEKGLGKMEFLSKEEIQDIKLEHQKLVQNISTLKQDVEEWRGNLDRQSKAHAQRLKEWRESLRKEVEALRSEFKDLSGKIKEQLEQTTSIVARETKAV